MNRLDYAIVEIEGLNINRLIDALISKGVVLHNLKRKSLSEIGFWLSQADLKKLFATADEKRYNIRILKQSGHKTLAAGALKRIGLIAGIVAACVLMVVYFSFVWTIDVLGNTKVESNQILSLLSQSGIKSGAPKSRVDHRELEAMLAKMPEISAASVKLKGSRLIVSITETLDYEPNIDLNEPRNIYSDCDGIVKSVLVLAGKPVVGVGQVVKKGDMLIEGVTEDTQELPLRECRATGEVVVTSWQKRDMFFYLERLTYERTGKKQVFKQIELFGKPFVKSNNKKTDFAHYESEQTIKPMFYGQLLPLKQRTRVYYECLPREVVLSLEQAKKEAEDKIIEQAEAEFIKDTVLGYHSVTTQIEGYYRLDTYIEIQRKFC